MSKAAQCMQCRCRAACHAAISTRVTTHVPPVIPGTFHLTPPPPPLPPNAKQPNTQTLHPLRSRVTIDCSIVMSAPAAVAVTHVELSILHLRHAFIDAQVQTPPPPLI